VPFAVFSKDVVHGCRCFVDEIVSDEVERLGQLDAGHVLDEPVVDQALSVAVKAGILDEELLFESLGEVELLARTDFVGEAVREDDLGIVSERSRERCDSGLTDLWSSTCDDLEGTRMFFEALCNEFMAGVIPCLFRA